MSSDLVYQVLVAVFSGAVGFMAGLAVSWNARTNDAGELVYTPTLNTNRGWRALFAIIAVLALGSVLLTAIVNDRNRESVQDQADCNDVNRDDVVNNVAMIRGIATLLAAPREERDPGAFPRLLDTFLTQADANQARRETIPGCEARE